MDNYLKNEKGFTLIELAISTIIVGILFAAVAIPYQTWKEGKDLKITKTNVEDMSWAITAYRSTHGHYPCPAAIDAPRDSAHYGRTTDCTSTSVAVNSCSASGSKYCVASGARAVTMDLDYDGISEPAFTPRVRIGMIPFRELNMPEEYAYDSFGNRIVYALTEEQGYSENGSTANLKNNAQAGGISVVYKSDYTSNTLKSRIQPVGSANFFIYSPGENQSGAYNFNGVLTGINCDEASSEGENCDFVDGAGVDAVFYASEISDSTGDDANDDIAVFQQPLNPPLWARSKTDPTDIYSIKSDINPEGKVGTDPNYNIYTDTSLVDPAETDTLAAYSAMYDKSRVWVGGNMKVEQDGLAGGQVQTSKLCDSLGKNCFDPSIIGGEGIKCSDPSNPAMKGVIEGNVDCTSSVVFDCPTGMIKSVTNGVPNCVPKPCPAQSFTLCSATFSAPKSEEGASYSYAGSGVDSCSRLTVQCRNGKWKETRKNWCNCTDSEKPYNLTCPVGCTGTNTGIESFNCSTCKTTKTSKTVCNCPKTPCIGANCGETPPHTSSPSDDDDDDGESEVGNPCSTGGSGHGGCNKKPKRKPKKNY